MIKKFNNYRKLKNSAVSEVFGTILLLLISVSVFSTVYASFFVVNIPPETPSVTLVATIENNNLIIYHRGGVSLGLGTFVIMNFIEGPSETFNISEKLDDKNTNSLWDVGEKISYDLDEIGSNYNRYNPIDIFVIDPVSNSVILQGTIQERRFSDLKIEIEIDNKEPEIDDEIEVRFKVTNLGPSYTSNIKVKIDLPYGLDYVDYNCDSGVYHHQNTTWIINNNLFPEIGYNVVKLRLRLKVGLSRLDRTQFVLIIDGSAGVSSENFSKIKEAIIQTINNRVFPLNIVELTVIQYGAEQDAQTIPLGYKVEVEPVLISDQETKDKICKQIMGIEQIGGLSPMACGLYAAESTLKSGPLINSWRQIINIITGSVPNIPCGDYSADPSEGLGKATARLARNSLISNLNLNDKQDEIDVVFIKNDTQITDYADWLVKNIAWPNGTLWIEDAQGQHVVPLGSGWVREIDEDKDLIECLNYNFNMLFYSRRIFAEIKSQANPDHVESNNFAEVLILPIINP